MREADIFPYIRQKHSHKEEWKRVTHLVKYDKHMNVKSTHDFDIDCYVSSLVRLKLGVRKDEHFRFANQSSNATYSINDKGVWKFWWHNGLCSKSSNVSLNWLMNKECRIERIGHGGE